MAIHNSRTWIQDSVSKFGIADVSTAHRALQIVGTTRHGAQVTFTFTLTKPQRSALKYAMKLQSDNNIEGSRHQGIKNSVLYNAAW